MCVLESWGEKVRRRVGEVIRPDDFVPCGELDGGCGAPISVRFTPIIV